MSEGLSAPASVSTGPRVTPGAGHVTRRYITGWGPGGNRELGISATGVITVRPNNTLVDQGNFVWCKISGNLCQNVFGCKKRADSSPRTPQTSG